MHNLLNVYNLSSDPSLNTGPELGVDIGDFITGQLVPGLSDGGLLGVNVVVMMNTDPCLKFSPH